MSPVVLNVRDGFLRESVATRAPEPMLGSYLWIHTVFAEVPVADTSASVTLRLVFEWLATVAAEEGDVVEVRECDAIHYSELLLRDDVESAAIWAVGGSVVLEYFAIFLLIIIYQFKFLLFEEPWLVNKVDDV